MSTESGLNRELELALGYACGFGQNANATNIKFGLEVKFKAGSAGGIQARARVISRQHSLAEGPHAAIRE